MVWPRSDHPGLSALLCGCPKHSPTHPLTQSSLTDPWSTSLLPSTLHRRTSLSTTTTSTFSFPLGFPSLLPSVKNHSTHLIHQSLPSTAEGTQVDSHPLGCRQVTHHPLQQPRVPACLPHYSHLTPHSTSLHFITNFDTTATTNNQHRQTTLLSLLAADCLPPLA